MSDNNTPKRNALGRRLLAAAQRRMLEREEGDQRGPIGAMDRASLALLSRAHGMLDRLDGVTETLEKVADLELKVVQKLVPIVDDLGELVRLTLNEARDRQGLRPKKQPVVIDAEVSASSDVPSPED